MLEGATVALAGAATGTVVALLAANIAAAHLFGVGPRDPVTFTAVPLLLLLAAIAASWLPARRAAGADPVVSLRSD